MPLYEYKKNAENKIQIQVQSKDKITFGTKNVIDEIVSCIGEKGNYALDGWYGVDFESIIAKIETELSKRGYAYEIININSILS